MSYVVKICEKGQADKYLGKDKSLVVDRDNAKMFTSPKGAKTGCERYVERSKQKWAIYEEIEVEKE